MNNVDKEYFRLLNTILKNGRVKKNRTGVDTIGVFGEQAKFDLAEGFPILTTKKVWFKGIVHELLWFIRGDTNIKHLVDNDVHIWDEWAYARYKKTPFNQLTADENGVEFLPKTEPAGPFTNYEYISQDYFIKQIKENPKFAQKWGELGYGTYGSTWTAFEVPQIPTHVEPRIKQLESPYDYRIASTLFVSTQSDNFVGTFWKTKSSGEFVVIERVSNDEEGRPVYKIQFTKTGFTKEVRKDVITKASAGDPYYPSVVGVGFLGNAHLSEDMDQHLYRVWSHMLDRCYNPNCREYPFYGAKGVFVCNRWLSFERFQQDVEQLPNWREKKLNPKKYQLDKDYYHSNCYSPDTCVWLKASENRRYQKKNGNQTRLPLPVNQLQKVLDKLKTNPDDRRMIVSAWHPYWVDHCALPPCHCLYHFNTEELTLHERQKIYYKSGNYTDWIKKGGLLLPAGEERFDEAGVPKRRLNCLLYQRSCDTFLGVPFNISSYALLTCMIAHVNNMVPGVFTHTYGDLHIYCNHMEQVKEQLRREPKALPSLWLNPEVKNLFDFKYEDIKLVNYDSHPTIKAEIAV